MPAPVGPPVDDLSQRSLVIVGNGASLLGSGRGAWIDQHDVVVRFNLFQTGKFAKDVGSRTTVWFNNRDATSATVRKILTTHAFERIYVHTWGDVNRAVATFEEELGRQTRAIPVLPVKKSVLSEMRLFFGENYSMYSTGAIGTWIMLQQYRQAALVGFDWWNAPSRHHYSDGEKFVCDPTRGHQPLLEMRFFEKLAGQGRITWAPDVGSHSAGSSEFKV